MTSLPAAKSSKVPLIGSIVVIAILAAAFAYTYETSNATIANQNNSIRTLNGQVTSYQGQVASLNANITSQASARHALQQELAAASTTVVSLSSEANALQQELAAASTTMASLSSEANSYSEQVSSQNSEIAVMQSTIGLQVQQTLLNSQTINMAFNSSTTVTHFTVSYGGYIQISGTSDTYIVLAVCYGATSQSSCDASSTYYLVHFGTSGIYNVPLMPGPVWINAYNYYAGTATLTVVEWI